MKILVVDLGHGGTDPGAVGPSKIFESNIVLSIGKKLNELLKGFNVEIKFTRLTENTFSNGVCVDISKIFNIRNRGVKLIRELSVLKNTKMPVALVEVDFISNPKAEQELNDSSNIEAVAMIIRRII